MHLLRKYKKTKTKLNHRTTCSTLENSGKVKKSKSGEKQKFKFQKPSQFTSKFISIAKVISITTPLLLTPPPSYHSQLNWYSSNVLRFILTNKLHFCKIRGKIMIIWIVSRCYTNSKLRCAKKAWAAISMWILQNACYLQSEILLTMKCN